MNHTQRRLFSAAAMLLSIGYQCYAIEVQVPNPVESIPQVLPTYNAAMPLTSSLNSSLTAGGTVTNNLGSFNIVIVPNASLSSNIPALNAFNRAAAQWEVRISDPITVTINGQLASLGAGIIGSASSTVLQAPYNTIRNQLVANSAPELDDTIVASLPVAASFAATVPAGYSLSGSVFGTKANLKAMGFAGLDGSFGVSDGTITFSSAFSFDYDNSDGVSPGTMDFEMVAAHEIGHTLGFFSAVDGVDAQINQDNIDGIPNPFAISLSTLDLFRFVDSASTALDPTNAANFATAARNLVPGANGITDFGTDTWGIGTEFRMSTGTNIGDGLQASHWKDSLGIGVMDPTLSFGEVVVITEADFRAFDLIGYDIVPIPEPSTYALGCMGLAAWCWYRRRRQAAM